MWYRLTSANKKFNFHPAHQNFLTAINSARAMNDKQLFAAASEGDLELVKNLLTQGADKEYIDDKVSEVI